MRGRLRRELGAVRGGRQLKHTVSIVRYGVVLRVCHLGAVRGAGVVEDCELQVQALRPRSHPKAHAARPKRWHVGGLDRADRLFGAVGMQLQPACEG